MGRIMILSTEKLNDSWLLGSWKNKSGTETREIGKRVEELRFHTDASDYRRKYTSLCDITGLFLMTTCNGINNEKYAYRDL